ncbi:MAG: adenylyl-sulfate kinase [Chloroflexi bacterium]|nr:adenylyl-sulfate kinase [Chloroflexota bacterium]
MIAPALHIPSLLEDWVLRRACAVWLTGLPASGKTTIGTALLQQLEHLSLEAELLDGDELRPWLSPDLGFSSEDRRQHNRKVARIGGLLLRHGVTVVVPIVSPYRSTRAFAREHLKHFLEVYVKCPLEECIRRDPKGLYAKALRGEIPEFTGISAPYEEPEHPEVIAETNFLTVDACVDRILEAMSNHGYLGDEIIE